MKKQLSSYENDDSEEAQAKIQELKVELESAQQDLRDTEFDRYIAEQEQLLSSLYTDYETVLNTRLDNIDFLLEQVINGINIAAIGGSAIETALGSGGAIVSAIAGAMGDNGTIKGVLNSELGAVGVTLSTAMNSIWSVGEGNAKSVLTMYGNNFQSQQTTTNATLSGIKTSVDKMAGASDKEAQNKVNTNKTSTSAKKDPTKNTTTTKPTTTQKDTTSNKSKSKSDKDYYGVALAIWNGNYGWGVGDTRVKRLKEKGFDANKMQKIVNELGKDGYVPSGAWEGKYHGIKNLSPYHYNKFAQGANNVNKSQLAWTQENGLEYIVRPSDGAILTPVAKGDSVLNATASGNIWNMANNPAEFIRDNLKLDAANVPNGANVQNSYTQHFENITFSMPNVKNYGELLSELQKDPKFNKLILAMTLDQVAGKSKLAKGKAIR